METMDFQNVHLSLKITSFDKMFSRSEILFCAFFQVQDSKMKSLSCFHSKVMVYRLVVVVVVLVFFQMKYFCS